MKTGNQEKGNRSLQRYLNRLEGSTKSHLYKNRVRSGSSHTISAAFPLTPDT
ncbi:MAG: hypothetical protein ACUVRL_02545 [Candidatus Saccharicenans sp.]|uniref:hypothetical protein n=1 Tax=Candidatus Saccharicenans sp. TaxID=2819258 RepID=UPI004049E4E2